MAHQQKLPFLSVTIFFSLLFIGHCSAQLFGGANSNVAVLTEAEFEDKVLEKGERWLIGFDNDDHFKAYASISEQVAEMVKEKINVGVVSETTGIKHGIRNLLTMKLYLGNGVTPIVVDSGNVDYIMNFVKAETLYRGRESRVTILTKEEFQSKVMERGERWLINFCGKSSSTCQDFAPLYEHTARILQGKINVGVVFDEEFAKVVLDKEIPKTQPVPTAFSLPTVIFFPGVTVYPDVRGEPVLYTGPKESLTLAAFARNRTPASSVRVLSPEDFKSEVLRSQDESSWLINFCPMTSQSQSRSTCLEFASKLEQVARQLKGVVNAEGALNIGAVTVPVRTDAIGWEEIELTEVDQNTEYPILKLYIGSSSGAAKTHILYTGATDPQSLYEFVRGQSSLSGLWCSNDNLNLDNDYNNLNLDDDYDYMDLHYKMPEENHGLEHSSTV